MPDLLWTDSDSKAVNTARALTADAVQKAGNGHPGAAISLAPVAHLLFSKIMRHDPSDPTWLGRDRFVLSAGHASLTLYLQLFLSGFGLELDDLKNLRQWESLTPAHPEYGHTPGVEMTTGPLGQGLSSAVGMAMGARRERGLFDPDAAAGTSPFDHFVYVLAGDGCLQEGITSEACSLAGTQQLGNLILIYDDNAITIEGDPSVTFTEDVLARYEAYGWHTQHVNWRAGSEYHEDVQALYDAVIAAQNETQRPSIIRLSTIMAWPSPGVKGTAAPHGNALGVEEVAALKETMGLNPEASFDISDELLSYTRGQVADRARAARETWDADFAAWQQANPENAELLRRLQAGELPEGWDDALPTFEVGASVATRSASGKAINALAPLLPELWGGSADLAGSNNTAINGAPSFIPDSCQTDTWSGNIYGRNLHFGVREHAMAAVVNGILLGGLTRPYCGTFFVFSDYMRPSVRLAALMNIPSIFVWTHDSIGVGEDGPTHQPIEHLWASRAIPGLSVIRPADANETVWAWKTIIEKDYEGPSALVLSRQNLPVLDGTNAEGVQRGGYVLADSPTGTVDVQILATGSEVALALEARAQLEAEGVGARVISLPCLEWFAQQPQDYRDSVLLPDVPARVSVEAGSTLGWAGLLGAKGRAIGIDHYGASAPGTLLFEKFGITADAVATAARDLL
ncbi:MAG: transketolase [Actinomycetaceae bacterium]|nr:transketolase [Actinomycetaceae bacterium]